MILNIMISIDSVFFHEDDYSLIEILPFQGDVDKMNDFFRFYTQKLTSTSLVSLNIAVDVFENIIQTCAIRHFRKVYTGYASKKKEVKNCRCFYYENYIIFYEHNNGKLMKCWINYSALEDSLNIYPLRLENALNSLGRSYNLFLVDWNEILVVSLNNKKALKDYIENNL
jgi:hypothetical protein